MRNTDLYNKLQQNSATKLPGLLYGNGKGRSKRIGSKPIQNLVLCHSLGVRQGLGYCPGLLALDKVSRDTLLETGEILGRTFGVYGVQIPVVSYVFCVACCTRSPVRLLRGEATENILVCIHMYPHRPRILSSAYYTLHSWPCRV